MLNTEISSDSTTAGHCDNQVHAGMTSSPSVAKTAACLTSSRLACRSFSSRLKFLPVLISIRPLRFLQAFIWSFRIDENANSYSSLFSSYKRVQCSFWLRTSSPP
jgi:hypothetical protein